MINKILFDNENAIFMGAKRSPENCSIGIFGVNYDGTCSFKPGARSVSYTHLTLPTILRV